MKLTRKLSLAVGLSICIVLAVHAWTRVASDSASYRADDARDHLIVGRSIASVVEMLWESDGMMSALEAVEQQNARTNDISIRWVELGALSPVMRTHHGRSARARRRSSSRCPRRSTAR